MPTQLYDAPSGKIEKRFKGILSILLDGVQSRNWNSERVIVFHSVILQHAQGVKNSAKMRKRIFFRLDLCHHGAFDELVKDMHNSAMGCLGKARGTKTMDECHRTFLNLVMKRKLREAVRFVFEREKGVFLQPNKLAEYCIGTINETVTSVPEGKHPSEKNPSCATL